MPEYQIFCSWPGCGYPGGPFYAPGWPASRITVGMGFWTAIPGRVTSLRSFHWHGAISQIQSLWDPWGNLHAQGGTTSSGWLSSSGGNVRLTIGQEYIVSSVSWLTPNSEYSEIGGMFTINPAAPYANYPLYAYRGLYAYHAASNAFPGEASTGSWYANDIVFAHMPPVWNTAASGSGQVNSFVNINFGAENMNNALAPFAYSAVAGTIPPGLSFSATTGVLSGVASQAGVYDLYIEAWNADGGIGRWVNISIGPRGRLDAWGMTGMVRH